jgi:hypothetical protein
VKVPTIQPLWANLSNPWCVCDVNVYKRHQIVAWSVELFRSAEAVVAVSAAGQQDITVKMWSTLLSPVRFVVILSAQTRMDRTVEHVLDDIDGDPNMSAPNHEIAWTWCGYRSKTIDSLV